MESPISLRSRFCRKLQERLARFAGGAPPAFQCDTPYEAWRCECGATGSGSIIAADLDEVAEGLLSILLIPGLEIPGSVSEPSIRVGDSGLVSMQRYDIPNTLSQLRQLLTARGYEMQTSAEVVGRSDRETHCIWIRRRAA